MRTPRSSFAIGWIRKMAVLHRHVASTSVNDSTAFYANFLFSFVCLKLFSLYLTPSSKSNIVNEIGLSLRSTWNFPKRRFLWCFDLNLQAFCELKDDTENGTANLDKRKVRPLFSPFQTDPKSSSSKYLNQLLHWKRVRFFPRRDLPKFFNLFSMFSTKLKRRRDL